MNTQRVSATLTTDDQEAVMAAIGTIREKLPFLVDLTKSQRARMARLGDRSEAFVRTALEVAVQNPGMLPASFDLEEMRRDAQLFDDLSTIHLAIDKLQHEVDDTTVQVGAEAYAAARTVYAATKTPYATPALRTAAGDLGRRFGRRRGQSASNSNGAAAIAPDDTKAP